MTNYNQDIKHRGRMEQIPMYLKKFFRMFIYMNDWVVIPMSVLVAAITSIVVAKDMFVNMEGTMKGALAISCICIWNGFFNSIQSICRERDIVKREHRNGMHITSYVLAHMIYQAVLCIIQTIITVAVCRASGMNFASKTMPLWQFYLYIGFTMFLITYAADTMSLMISAIAKTTTSAMTVMPFMLIFELVFSDSVFKLGGKLRWLTDLSIAKWGVRCIAAQADYNSLPLVSLWNQLMKWRDLDYYGVHPIEIFTEQVDKDQFCLLVAEKSIDPAYENTFSNIGNCWVALIAFTIIFAIITILSLKRIDTDKR